MPSVTIFFGLGVEITGTLREVGFRNGQWEEGIAMQKIIAQTPKMR